MADVADIAAEIEAESVALGLARAVKPVPAGEPGECKQCEWWMPRLVEGRCAFCRDGRQRPPDWEPPTPPSATPAVPAPSSQETRPMSGKSITAPMSGKSIMLPASAATAIAAVQRRAQENVISLGQAAADLIEFGLAANKAAATEALAPVRAEAQTLEDLLDAVRDRFASQEQASVDAAIADADARAAAAEAKLARITAALA